MTRTHSLVPLLLAAAVAVPAVAGAQRRGGGESDGGAGGRSSSGESVGTAVPRSPDPAPSYPSQPSGSSSPSSSGSPVVGSTGPRTTGGGTVVRGTGGGGAAGRTTNGRVIRGTAQPRTGPIPGEGGSSFYYPYSYYQPGYYLGSYGYYNYYDPWFFGAASWRWGGYGYGPWHDPFGYSGAYFGPWPYYWGDGGSVTQRSDDRESFASGSLRLRVSPKTAKVYVDGALVGIVDEFDGLGGHLGLPAGRHQVEFRADGYVSRTIDVVIEKGKTRTERVSLTATPR